MPSLSLFISVNDYSIINFSWLISALMIKNHPCFLRSPNTFFGPYLTPKSYYQKTIQYSCEIWLVCCLANFPSKSRLLSLLSIFILCMCKILFSDPNDLLVLRLFSDSSWLCQRNSSFNAAITVCVRYLIFQTFCYRASCSPKRQATK